MNVRIVVVDERQANFFHASSPRAPLVERGSVQNETGGMRDTELETDRAGRRFGGTSGVRHGVGVQGGHHHGVDGERSTKQHELTLFAKEVAQRIDSDRINHKFEKLVLIAPPKMLGLLRQSLTKHSQSMLAAEISKDLLQLGPEAILDAVPMETFWTV
jgi:protein required for attachment to host cells